MRGETDHARRVQCWRQVCAADARVKKLRDEVPMVLTESIQQHLVACRPAALEVLSAMGTAGALPATGKTHLSEGHYGSGIDVAPLA